MEMGVEEIRRQYKYAKDRKKCISILADLNCCSKDDIKTVLNLNETHGDKITESKKITLNDAEIKTLYDRLDELDEAIRPLENEYRRTVNMIMSLGR